MNIDKTTYKDKEENQIGLTDDHASQPNKVLFFAGTHFFAKGHLLLFSMPKSFNKLNNPAQVNHFFNLLLK